MFAKHILQPVTQSLQNCEDQMWTRTKPECPFVLFYGLLQMPALGYEYSLVVVYWFPEQVESSCQRATALTMAKEKRKKKKNRKKYCFCFSNLGNSHFSNKRILGLLYGYQRTL